MDDEQAQPLGKPSAIAAKLGWQSLIPLSGDALEAQYRHIPRL
jgi:hypothetical protein